MRTVLVHRISEFNCGKYNSCYPVVACIGKFELLHLGHQALFRRVLFSAYKEKKKSAVVIISLVRKSSLLEKKLQKELLRIYKFDYCYWIVLDQFNMKVSKKEFVNFLKKAKFESVVVGENFRFGYNRDGDVSYLRSEGLDVKTIKEIRINQNSSRKISTSCVSNMIFNSRFFEVFFKSTARYYWFEAELILFKKIKRILNTKLKFYSFLLRSDKYNVIPLLWKLLGLDGYYEIILEVDQKIIVFIDVCFHVRSIKKKTVELEMTISNSFCNFDWRLFTGWRKVRLSVVREKY